MKGSKNRKVRPITVDNIGYKWHCSGPDEDYGAKIVRAWRGKKLLFRLWVHPVDEPIITPRFVAAQIKKPTPERYSFEGYYGSTTG